MMSNISASPIIATLTALLILILALAALAVVYHKLSKAIHGIREELPRISSNTIRQLEALWAIQQEMGLRHPIPQTRGWAASPDFLRVLMDHALFHKPRVIVECSSGISTLVLARCVQISGWGHVHSLEHDPIFAEKTRRTLEAEGLDSFATVYDAPLRELKLPGWTGKWYTHDVLPDSIQIDMLVVDGPPWFVSELPRYPAIPVLIPKLALDGFVYLDDADRPEEKEIVRRWTQDYDQLEKIQVPVCEKGCVGLRLIGASTPK